MSCSRVYPVISANEPLQLHVVGIMHEAEFHYAACAAQTLKQSFASNFLDPTFKPLLEFAWHEFLEEKKRELKGETWGFSSSVMCFINGHLLGDDTDLIKWANEYWSYKDYRPLSLYKALAEDFFSKHIKSKKNAFVYLDIAIEDEPAGRLLFEIFRERCPKTCERFQALCGSPAVIHPTHGNSSYKGTTFSRIVKNGWIQGGDIHSGSTEGDKSNFRNLFADESFAVPHNKRGVLGMANRGHHSNGTQFYITLQATPYMDRKYVAFGQLVEGTVVLQKLEAVPTINERPTTQCVVTECGTLML